MAANDERAPEATKQCPGGGDLRIGFFRKENAPDDFLGSDRGRREELRMRANESNFL